MFGSTFNKKRIDTLEHYSCFFVLYRDLKGVIVTLNDSGHLQCSYLGTDPSLFQAPKVEARDINYEEYDSEMNRLQKIIKEAKKFKGMFFFIDTISVGAVIYINYQLYNLNSSYLFTLECTG